MANQADLDFAGKIGGRTVQDNRDRSLANQPESLAARIKRVQEDAIEAKAVAQAFGLNEVKVEPASNKDDKEAPSVVNAALSQMNNMIKETSEMAKDKGTELKEARKDADEARSNLFTTQLQVIQQMQGSLLESQKRMSEQNSPEAAIAIVEKWESIFNKFRPQVTTDNPIATAKISSDQTTITLEKMRQEHDLEMEKIKAAREEVNNRFQLQMLQFQDESRRKYKEYEDGVKFRNNAYNGFSDLAASIAAGIDKERGGQSAVGEGIIEAAMSGFSCKNCGTHIDIPDGVSKVKCANSECGAEYKIEVSH